MHVRALLCMLGISGQRGRRCPLSYNRAHYVPIFGPSSLCPPANQLVASAGVNWPRGVTVSTLDSESSDRGSNPREASALLPLFYGRHELEVSRTLPASGFAFCPCGLEALGVGYFNRHLD